MVHQQQPKMVGKQEKLCVYNMYLYQGLNIYFFILFYFMIHLYMSARCLRWGMVILLEMISLWYSVTSHIILLMQTGFGLMCHFVYVYKPSAIIMMLGCTWKIFDHMGKIPTSHKTKIMVLQNKWFLFMFQALKTTVK